MMIDMSNISPYVLPGLMEQDKSLNIDFIMRVVCKYFKIEPQMLFLRTRRKEIRQTRQIVIYFIRTILNHSCMSIARYFSFDHTTVLYTIKTVNNEIDTNEQYRETINTIRNHILLENAA